MAAMSTDTAVPRTERPLRADAERNRRRILESARVVFADHGLDATLDDVADHAGVGIGTVYRRFPSKAHLVDALFEDRLAGCAELVEAAADRADPASALLEVIEALAELYTADRGIREVTFGTTFGNPGLAHSLDRLHTAMARLVARARDSGAIRPDLDPTDIPVLLVTLSSIAELGRSFDPRLWRRFLPIVLDGVRATDGQTPLTHPPLDLDHLDEAMRTNQHGHHRGGG